MLTVTGKDSFSGVLLIKAEFETWEELVAWAETKSIPEDWISPECQFERQERVAGYSAFGSIKVIYKIEFS